MTLTGIFIGIWMILMFGVCARIADEVTLIRKKLDKER